MHHATTVICTNIISSMLFDVRPRLVLETRLVLEQIQSDPRLVLETRLVYENRLLLEEIQYSNAKQELITALNSNMDCLAGGESKVNTPI